MMIVMKESATTEQVEAVVRQVEQVGARAHVSRGELHTVIGAIGDRDHVSNLELEGFPGVDHIVPITRPYKLASLQFKREERTVLDIGGRKIGGPYFMTIAGPCTIESRGQMLDAAAAVKDACAAGPTSRARRPTPSRGSARAACACWPKRASRPASRS
jgi:3-deoxy-7-phosphoheptulonate synthase